MWSPFSFLILAIISLCHLLCLNAWLLTCALYGLVTNTGFEDCPFLIQYIKLCALASKCNCVRTWTFCHNLEHFHTRLLEDAGRTQSQASSTQWYSGRHNLRTKSLPGRSFLCEEAADCQVRHALGIRLQYTLHGRRPASTHIPYPFSLWEGWLATLVLNPHLSRGSLSTRKIILHYLLDQLDSKELSENVFLLSFLSKSK